MEMLLSKAEYELLFKTFKGYPTKKIKTDIGHFGIVLGDMRAYAIVETELKTFMKLCKKRY